MTHEQDPIDVMSKAWEAKTPGPWSTVRGADGWDIDAPSGLVTMDAGMRGRDAAFIAITGNYLGTLLARLQAAEAENERLKAVVAHQSGPPDGYRFEPVAEDATKLRIVSTEQVCRMPGCNRRAVAELNRGYRTKHGRVDSWWAYCEYHLYGRWIEGGHVLHWRLVPIADGAQP